MILGPSPPHNWVEDDRDPELGQIVVAYDFSEAAGSAFLACQNNGLLGYQLVWVTPLSKSWQIFLYLPL
jgi:hypothetical protein